MSEHECTEHLYDEIERLRESNFQLRQGAEEQKQRIKQLEESLESANTLLQLVMCEQNQLRDVRNKANDRIKQLEDELNKLRSNESRLLNSNGEFERRINRLEEAGDALCENSSPSRWDSPTDAARKMIDQSNWNKAKEAKP